VAAYEFFFAGQRSPSQVIFIIAGRQDLPKEIAGFGVEKITSISYFRVKCPQDQDFCFRTNDMVFKFSLHLS
jgi:hypothetical protein